MGENKIKIFHIDIKYPTIIELPKIFDGKNTRAERIPHSIYISKAIRNSEARLHKKNL